MRTITVALAGLVAAVALVGAGSAAAADRPAGQALIDQIAAKLGVTPDQLRTAWKGVLFDRIDAAVKAGKLTPERAAALKQRLEEGKLPRLGKHGHAFGHRKVAHVKALKAAADALGLSLGQLRQELRSGKTLAQIAAAKGVSIDALVTAMLKPLEARLTKAVEAGRITEAKKAERLAAAKQRLTERLTKPSA